MFLYCPWHDVVLVFCHAFFIQRIEWYYVSVAYVGHRLIWSPLISDQPMFDSACPKCCWIWICSQSLNNKVLLWFSLFSWPNLMRIFLSGFDSMTWFVQDLLCLNLFPESELILFSPQLSIAYHAESDDVGAGNDITSIWSFYSGFFFCISICCLFVVEYYFVRFC